MAADGTLNLIDGDSDSLYLDFGHEAFRHELPPFNLRRRPKGPTIAKFRVGFDYGFEVHTNRQAVVLAQVRIGQFAARLSHHAGMLVRMATELPARATEPFKHLARNVF